MVWIMAETTQTIDVEIESKAQGAISDLDKVDSALERIEKAIIGISDKLDKFKNLDNLSRSVDSIANSLSKIDASKLNKAASAISSLSNVSETAERKVTKAFDNISQTMSESEREIDKSAKKIAKDFNFDKNGNGIEETKRALTDLYNAIKVFQTTGKYDGVPIAHENLQKVIQDYGRIKVVLTETQKAALDTIKAINQSGTKIDLGSIVQDYAHNLKELTRLKSVLGTAFKGNTQGGTPFDTWFDVSHFPEIRSELEKFTDDGKNSFKVLADYIGRIKQISKEGYMSVKDFAEAVRSAFNPIAMENGKDVVRDPFETIKGTANDYFNTLNKIVTKESEVADVINQKFLPTISEMQTQMGGFDDYVERAFKLDMGQMGFAQILDPIKQLPDLIQATSSPLYFFVQQLQNVGTTVPILNRVSDDIKLIGEDTSKTATLFLPMKEQAEVISQDIVDMFEQASSQIDEALSSGAKSDTWENVIKEIQQMENDYEQLAKVIGEANAEMQIAQNIHNRLSRAFSDTSSGKMLFDIPNMQKAQAMLNLVDDRLKRFHADLKDPFKLEIDVTEPVNQIEQLYARLRELQSLISDMKNNKINFTDDQYLSALKEYESIQKKIKEIENPKVKESGGMEKANSGALEFMATVIALQHELDKVAGLMDKFGNIAISAFKKALTPLKLFEHEFDHIKTMVTRIGSAFAMISKPITKVFNDMQKKWTQAINAMEKRMSKLMRTFVYMGFRKIFTAIYKTMGEAIKSLAAFSKSIGTDFNYSMSLLTSDLRYLGASIVAAFEPLINVVVPILDKFVDVLVEAINKVNMFFTALTGAKSFTIAKKKIVDYTDAMNKASKAAKQLTMGIDELNILNDSKSSDSDLDDLFDWQEIDSSAIPKSIQDAADKIKDIAKQLWNPIKQAWDNVGDYVKDSFKRMINSIGALLKDIGRDFLEVWNQPRTVHMLEQILGILGDIFNIIANIADGWREAWNYNETGKKMLEDIRDLLDVIFTHIHNITSAMVEWTAQLDWKPLFVAIEYALQKLVYAVDQIGYVVEDLFDLFMKLGKYLIEDWAPRLIKVFGDVEEGIGNIAKQIHNAWQEVDFGTKVADGIDGIMQEILPHLEELGTYFKEWANGLDFKPLMNAFVDLLAALKPLADFVSGTLVEAFEKLILGEIQHLIEDIIPKISQGFSDFLNAVNFDQLRKEFSTLIDAAEHLQHAISGGVADAIGKLGQHLAKFINSKNFTDFIDNLANFVNRISPEMISKILEGIGLAILYIADGLAKFVNSKPFQDFLDSLISFMENTSAEKIADTLVKLAKAIIAFKGISAAIKALSGLSSILPILMGLAKIITPQGALVTGIIALAGAFILFGDQIAAIDWAKLGKMLYDGIIGLVEKIDWESVGKNLGKVIGDLLVLVFETVLDPAWQARMMAVGIKAIVGLISGLQQGIFAALAGAFEQAGLDVVAGFIRGIASAWEAIWDFIGGLIQRFIDFVKGILGIQSPSTVFAEIGTNIVLGLLEGIRAAWQLIIDFFTTCWETVKELFTTAWTAIIETLRTLWSTVYNIASELWGAVRDFLITVFDTVSESWSTIWTTIFTFLSEIWQSLQSMADTVFGFIRELIINAWNTIETLTNKVWNFIKNLVVSVLETLQKTVNEVISFIKIFISEAWEFIKSVTESVWNGVRDFLLSVWNLIKSKAESLFGALRSFLGSLWDGLLEAWSSVWNAITSAVTSIWLAFTGTVHDIWDWVTDFLKGLWDSIEGAWTSVWNSIVSALEKIWRDFVGGIHDIWDGVKDFIEKLFDKVSGIWSTVWNAIINTIIGIWNAFISKLQSLWSSVVSFVSSIWDGVSSAWKTVWNAIADVIGKAVKAMMGFFNDLMTPIKAVMDAIKWVIDKAGDVKDALKNAFSDIADGIGGVVSKIDLHIPGFATGGFPPEDGWFRASHGEIMGRFDNGQSVIASNKQITDAIREAVAGAMIPILEEIAVNTRETADKDMSLSIDSREIARANNTGQSKLGRTLLTTT